jgi:undecaprenyl-diphosphatase
MLVASMLTAATVEIVKPLSGRARPSETALVLADATPVAINGRNSSFPSGHAATAFAFARVLSLAYPAVTPVCMVAAAGTAASRIFEHRHFFSDCVAGAAIGWLIATWCWRVKVRWKVRSNPESSAPTVNWPLRWAA